MLRLTIKYTALGTLLTALIASPGLGKAFAMGGGGGGGTVMAPREILRPTKKVLRPTRTGWARMRF